MSVDYNDFFEEHKGVRAYSYEQFWDEIYENAYFDFDEFRICQTVGTYEGRLIMKRWGEKRNIIAYVDCTEKNKRKIKCTAFADTDYLGLADIPMGTYIRITYEKSKRSNKTRLAAVEIIDEDQVCK